MHACMYACMYMNNANTSAGYVPRRQLPGLVLHLLHHDLGLIRGELQPLAVHNLGVHAERPGWVPSHMMLC